MENIKEYWDEVNAIQKKLIEDGNREVLLVSLTKKKLQVVGGRFVTASAHVAAMMINQESHRVATRQEAIDWANDQVARGKAQRELQASKEAKVQVQSVDLSSVSDLVAQIIRQSQQSQAPPPPPEAPAEVPAAVAQAATGSSRKQQQA